MYNSVMVDVETMGTNSASPVIAIGAIAFDIAGPRIEESEVDIETALHCFYVNVDLQSCLDLGLTPDGPTMMWWLTQSTEARKQLCTPTPIPVLTAINLFTEWYKLNTVNNAKIFAHANFDLVLLDNLYRRMKQRAPWKYYDARDVRTIYAVAFNNEKVPGVPDELKHNALWDAYRQAVGVQICYKQLKS